LTAIACTLLIGATLLALASMWRDILIRRMAIDSAVAAAKAERLAEWGELLKRVEHLENSQPIGGARQGRRVT
jgi:c-di-GMP-related signal transduction protein